ncbi:2OG-Fe(II) oxygenase [Bradyrhizobium japonicum]|uniref:2OG-Fe(II) oxygenase n=1 Tax=Bradyrhizobium japonicum TaxID=375 RepID=UPI00057FC652|nr:2OG-Fe(II) oxygenase [Bradyrhizobium japonicum]MCD9112275.1 2OG-Fe(II) oxygenase [Bradyrhizobium japonicum]MCD9258235.1 2OG-Fe(II) oxygenase [Bradyrhizobium japonicum SEMIA 5079]MCD9824514.1 2OG-Fe(II) oxygenase [Bradyrhizobium japonicum]MCD9897203.1 2OG-Fe(II) oxygenase [Bradyrhizobium japonicum]MCD9912526.1 2OG-Fe(II) oxygenase [Bradyrhizobium japonicum]
MARAMKDKSCLLSEEVLTKYRIELLVKGSVVIAPQMLFTQDDIARIDQLRAEIPEEEVREGDAGDLHSVFVQRVRVDPPGHAPSNVSGTASGQIMELLESRDRSFALRKIFGASADYVVRRCQMHRMPPGSFIGIHLDAASDPDFEYSVIVQLARDFDGGEFVVYPTGYEQHVFRPPFGAVLVTTCKVRHEVKPVSSGERRSLVYFCSKRSGVNRRIIEGSNARP